MKVYWAILALSFAVWYMAANSKQTTYGTYTYQKKIRERQIPVLLLFFSVLTILCGLRSGIADTGAYIHNFNTLPLVSEEVDWDKVSDRKGFYWLMFLYKTCISVDYHGWLFLIALVSCIALAIGFHKYASDVGFSCFLFIATTTFTYLVNGIRQFIPVTIFFAVTCWITDKKYIRYIALVALLSTIHSTAWIMIPVYFLVRTKPWSGFTFLILGGGIFFGFAFDTFFPMVNSALSGTEYQQYSEILQTDSGSSIFRLAIAVVPIILSFLCRKQIAETEDKVIPIATNMSMINVALYAVATMTSGMAVGRVTAYFDIYNLILVPWLINNYPSLKDRNALKVCAILGYIAFFYMQMVLTWNLAYESDILKLFVYS